MKEVWRNRVDDVLRIFIEETGDDSVQKATAPEKNIFNVPPMAFPDNETSTIPKPAPTADPALHVGVSCDGCDGPVQGMRYKCLICPDYDLCERCEEKHLHNQHPMIRIVSPQDDTWKVKSVPCFFLNRVKINVLIGFL